MLPEPVPLCPTRHTAETMRSDAETMANHLAELMTPTPGTAQWRAAESLALGILSAVRKGRTAHQLVLAANAAADAKRQTGEDAMVVQLDRMGMHETAERLPTVHPVFSGILSSIQSHA